MNNEDQKQVHFISRINPVLNAMSSSVNGIGQIGGIDTSFDGKIVVFHRGSRKWDFDSFTNDVFNTAKYGPIAENVLSLIDAKTSKLISSWGANM